MSDHTPFFPENLDDYAPWVAKHGLVAPYGKCQCGCGEDAPISSKTSVAFLRAKGKPARFIGGHNSKVHRTRRIEKRFWSRVDKRGPDECWEWKGFVNADGYGSIGYMAKYARAHRVSYELHNGPIPAGLEVCHSCDNPGCVNPAHLWLGTHFDNVRDMIRKGRHAALKGSANGNSKLTESDVVVIRELADSGQVSRRDLAETYKVSLAAINKVCSRQAWRHVK